MHQTEQRYGGTSVRRQQHYESATLLGNDVGSGTDGAWIPESGALPRALHHVQVVSATGARQARSQILLRGALAQLKTESEGLQVRHHPSFLQAGQIRGIRPDHEVRPGESAQTGRQREEVAAEITLEQAPVLRVVGDQTEEQNHLSPAAFDRAAKNGQNVHREEAASAAYSRYHEDQKSAETADTNGGDSEPVEESRRIYAGYEETR